MATYKRISWSQSGKQIDIDIYTDGYFGISVNGNFHSTQGIIIAPAAKERAMYAQRGAVGTLGPVIIYKDRAVELLALQEEAKAAPKPRNLLGEYLVLEADVLVTERTVQEQHENPAYAYAQRDKAKAALHTWIEASPENRTAYEEEVARRREEEASRRGEPLGEDIWNH